MIITETLAADMKYHGYHLIRLLGEGGVGSVFEARQISTGQTVALKLLRQDAKSDTLSQQRMVDRFERETHLCAQLHHPHIVKLLDKGRTHMSDQKGAQQLFAVFEYVPGETLKDLLLRKGAMSALAAGELMGQVLDALAAAHDQGIVHRDLKPHNIMIMRTGVRPQAKVLDFGIAAFIPERQMADYRNLTIAQETMCSPSYSAPEQLRGEPPTLKTDLYAWGLLFLECLTGRPAIEGLTLAEIFHKQLSSVEVPIPTGLLSHPLGDLLRRVLRKSPLERAGRASVLYEDFQQINLTNIVGDLRAYLHDTSETHASNAVLPSITQPSASAWLGMADDRQQITVLCCTLAVSVQANSEAELDALEALQRDQLNLCIDTATRYGGHLAGSLGNSLLFYFGYPHVADTDARRCARSALELISQVRRRSPLLALQHGCRLAIRVSIHSGIVRVRQAYLPTGITPNVALQLAHLAPAGAVLVSAPARKMLDQFMEFEGGGVFVVEGSSESLGYSSLAGEYSAEAGSFLRSGNSGRALVGREQEFATLRQAWDAATKRQSGAVLIRGEAGMGKSRLGYEAALLARQQGGITKECRCLPEYQNNALYPILAMLKTHWNINPSSDAQDAQHNADAVARLESALESLGCAVEAVLPVLCSWLALPLPEAYPLLQFSPELQKRMLLDALRRLILQIGDGQTLLLVFEDMHWIDQTSLELVTQMIQTLPQHAVLILMTARPNFVAPWTAGQVQLLQVERLAERAAEQLISNIIGGKPIAAASLRRLCERTDGIPLFAEELTRMLQDKQLLVERQGMFHLDERFNATDIPVSLRDLLSARLARLGAAKESAQLASAIGREFDYSLLVEVSLADEARLQYDLDQMVAAGLIYCQRRVHGDSYIFHHALLRDAAYDAMPKRVREQTHVRIAHQLESRSEAGIERDLPQLARHFALATEFSAAVKYGIRAAQTSLERALHDDAIKMVDMVQQWITLLDENQQRDAAIGISRISTNALMSKYGWADARVKDGAETALRLIEDIDDASLLVPTLWDLAFYHHVAGHRRDVRSLTDQLSLLSGKSGDRGLQAASNTIRGIGVWIDGEHDMAARLLEQALNEFDPARHDNHGYGLGLDFRVWAMAGMGCIQWFMDTDDESVFARARAAVAYARQINHIPSLGVALMYLAFDYQWSDDRINALAVSSEMLELAQKYGLPAVEAYGAIIHSWATSNLTVADQVLTGLEGMGCMLGFTCVSAMAAEIEAHRGNYSAALARIEKSLALADQSGELYYKPELLIRRAVFRDASSHPDRQRSRSDLQNAIKLAEAVGKKRSVRNAKLALNDLEVDVLAVDLVSAGDGQ